MDGRGFTRKEYDEICRKAKTMNIGIASKYRKGMKSIRIEPIVLSSVHCSNER